MSLCRIRYHARWNSTILYRRSLGLFFICMVRDPAFSSRLAAVREQKSNPAHYRSGFVNWLVRSKHFPTNSAKLLPRAPCPLLVDLHRDPPPSRPHRRRKPLAKFIGGFPIRSKAGGNGNHMALPIWRCLWALA